MHYIGQIFFIIITIAAIALFTKNVKRIRRNILLGKDEVIDDHKEERWKNVLLLAFGQKKMFKKPVIGILHFLVYAGFIIINIEILEIIIDGLTGTHRIFSGIGSLYSFLINTFEILAALVWISCAIFLVRRNILKIKRLNMPEMQGWPKEDANAILCTEIVLMSLFLIMNATDTLLQSRGFGEYGQVHTGNFILSGLIQPLFEGCSDTTLVAIERSCWFLHIIGIYAFLNYLPYSKHLHVLLAFPNSYYSSLKPHGEMSNMKDIQNEVLYAMQPELAPTEPAAKLDFGAKDVTDLSWKSLLDAYSCTECGRCTAACPANITGKKLSPRKIMMDTRDRVEEVGKNIDANGGSFVDDGKTLLRDYISEEELRACTTCNACVEECPVSISPLNIILQMRRFLIMEESNAPAEWNNVFSNIETNMAPWKFAPDERDAWTRE